MIAPILAYQGLTDASAHEFGPEQQNWSLAGATLSVESPARRCLNVAVSAMSGPTRMEEGTARGILESSSEAPDQRLRHAVAAHNREATQIRFEVEALPWGGASVVPTEVRTGAPGPCSWVPYTSPLNRPTGLPPGRYTGSDILDALPGLWAGEGTLEVRTVGTRAAVGNVSLDIESATTIRDVLLALGQPMFDAGTPLAWSLVEHERSDAGWLLEVGTIVAPPALDGAGAPGVRLGASVQEGERHEVRYSTGLVELRDPVTGEVVGTRQEATYPLPLPPDTARPGAPAPDAP